MVMELSSQHGCCPLEFSPEAGGSSDNGGRGHVAERWWILGPEVVLCKKNGTGEHLTVRI